MRKPNFKCDFPSYILPRGNCKKNITYHIMDKIHTYILENYIKHNYKQTLTNDLYFICRCEEPGCDYTTHHIDNFKRHEEKVHQGIR